MTDGCHDELGPGLKRLASLAAVTVYPTGNIEELLGYTDELLSTGELYHLFAIDADRLPFHLAGLNVKWEM